MGLPLPWPWGLWGRGNSSANHQLLQSSLLLIRELTCEKSAKCPLAHSLLGKESLHSTAWLSTQAISRIFRQQKISAFWISLQRDSLVIKVQTGKAVAGFTGLYEQLVDWSNQHFSYLRYFQDMGIFSNCFLGSCIFFFFSFDLLEEFLTLTVMQLFLYSVESTLVQHYQIPTLFLRISVAKRSTTALSLSSASQSSAPRSPSVGKILCIFLLKLSSQKRSREPECGHS